MLFWKYASFLLLLNQASAFPNMTGNVTFHDPAAFGVDMSRMSLTTYFNLANDSFETPKLKNFFEQAEPQARRFPENPLKTWGATKDVVYSCYYIHTTMRNARTDLHRYYWRRTLYRSTLEYEVGYLTHEIIWRYRTVLELYHYLVYWYEKYPARNFAPTKLIFYFYTNVLNHCKMIIHLCQMMHEIEKKYRMPREKGVFDDYEIGKEGGPSSSKSKSKYNRTIVDHHLAEYEKYLRKLKEEAKRKKKEAREMRKNVLKLGTTTTRGKATQKKKSHWPLDYGWSIENW